MNMKIRVYFLAEAKFFPNILYGQACRIYSEPLRNLCRTKRWLHVPVACEGCRVGAVPSPAFLSSKLYPHSCLRTLCKL